MNTEDFALVVGISRYGGFGSLLGPENDANAFVEWLKDPNGGAVPEGNITKITSSEWLGDKLDSIADFMPRADKIIQRLDHYHDRGLKARYRVGRRLYLYFAGHGISTFGPRNGRRFDDIAILAASATASRYADHVAATLYAEFFSGAAFFEEVVLFFDCCRTHHKLIPINRPTYDPVQHLGKVANAYLYGFATKWDGSAHEQPFSTGKTHGYFSHALLAGLRGGAANDGVVTPARLEGFVKRTVAGLLVGDQRQDPEFDFSVDPVVQFGVGPRTPQYSLRLSPGAFQAFREVELRNGSLGLMNPQMAGSEWLWAALEFGLYQLAVDGQVAEFRVDGSLRQLQATIVDGKLRIQ